MGDDDADVDDVKHLLPRDGRELKEFILIKIIEKNQSAGQIDRDDWQVDTRSFQKCGLKEREDEHKRRRKENQNDLPSLGFCDLTREGKQNDEREQHKHIVVGNEQNAQKRLLHGQCVTKQLIVDDGITRSHEVRV